MGALSLTALALAAAHGATSLHHLRGLEDTRRHHLTARAALAFINVAPEEQLLQRRVFPWVDRLEVRANALDRRGLLRPPLIASDRVGDIAHEWGSFRIGDSTGCYVILRRAVDSWKIHREWIVEPCEH